MNLDPALSSGYYVDVPRDCVHPTRSQSASVADYPFDNLTGWTNFSGGTASAGIIGDPTPDPAIGNVVDLQTGATLGSTAGIQKTAASIPASFGALIIDELTAVGTNPADALQVFIQNCQSTNLMLRLYQSAVEVFQDGAWRLLFAHGGAYWTEWWIEAAKQVSGAHTVSLYAGTACVGARNGYLPGGPSGNDNLVLIQQPSVTASRHSKVAILQIGATQLPDAMTLTSEAVEAIKEPKKASVRLTVENVSENLAPNRNLIVRVSKDNGLTWMQVPLFDNGLYGPGVIDPAKQVRIISGKTRLVGSGRQMRWRVETATGSFLPLRKMEFQWA